MTECRGDEKVRFDLKQVAQFDKQNQLELDRKGKHQPKKAKGRANVFQDDGFDGDRREVQSNYRDRAVERRRQEQDLDIHKLNDNEDAESEIESDKEEREDSFQEVKGLDFSLLAKIRAQTDQALRDLQSKGLLKPTIPLNNNLQDDDREEIAELRRRKMQTATKMGNSIRKLLFPDSLPSSETPAPSSISNKASQMIARTVLVFDHSQPLPRSLLLSGRLAYTNPNLPSCFYRDDYNHIPPELLTRLQIALNKPKVLPKVAVKAAEVIPKPAIITNTFNIYDEEEVIQGDYDSLVLSSLLLKHKEVQPLESGYTAAVIFDDDDNSSQQKVKGLFSSRGSNANNIFAPLHSSSSSSCQPAASALIFSSSFGISKAASAKPAAVTANKTLASCSASKGQEEVGTVHRDIFLGPSFSEQRKQQNAATKRKLQQEDVENERDYYEGDAYDFAYASDENSGEGGRKQGGGAGKVKRKRSAGGKGAGIGSP